MSPKRTVEIIPVSEPEHRDGIVGSEAESKAGSGPELGRDNRIVNSAWLGPMRRSSPTARYFAKNRLSANEERSLAERIKAGHRCRTAHCYQATRRHTRRSSRLRSFGRLGLFGKRRLDPCRTRRLSQRRSSCQSFGQSSCCPRPKIQRQHRTDRYRHGQSGALDRPSRDFESQGMRSARSTLAACHPGRIWNVIAVTALDYF
jgi:hypothetical protein